LTTSGVAGPIAFVRALFPSFSLLIVVAGCSHAARPRPAEAPRQLPPIAPPEAPTPEAVVAAAPPDADSVAMRRSVARWLERAAEQLGRRLSIVQAGTAAPVGWEANVWCIPVVVRDEESGVSLPFNAFGRNANQWEWDDRNDAFVTAVSAAFALRAAPDWLAAHPEVIAWTREEPESLAVTWSLTTLAGTTMCTDVTPSHGLPIRGCWPEAGSPLPLGGQSFVYHYDRRSEVRGAFEVRLANGERGRVRVRIDEAGRVWRAQSAARGAFGPERPVPVTAPPAAGPLALLKATPVPGDANAMTLTTETESMRCERGAAWRCDAVVAIAATR